MARKITGAYPLNVKEVILTDGRRFEDATVWITDRFLIVATDGRPDMYNLNLCAEIHGAEEIRPNSNIWSI